MTTPDRTHPLPCEHGIAYDAYCPDCAVPAVTRLQQERVTRLRRDILASLIAVKGSLNEPYPDDPRWTPWTRFIERTLDRVDELAGIATDAVSGGS